MGSAAERPSGRRQAEKYSPKQQGVLKSGQLTLPRYVRGSRSRRWSIAGTAYSQQQPARSAAAAFAERRSSFAAWRWLLQPVPLLAAHHTRGGQHGGAVPGGVALIDLPYVLKNHGGFNHRLEELRREAEGAENDLKTKRD